ncbi:redoxin domain-containing protein [Haloarchaeobius sp. DFWS5]|uniref:redoxin domain-containing protein n=1 Tax=Haloarchaeobius sp. DFWS5 TaxID=3446114 RepID=UPI003EBCBFD4
MPPEVGERAPGFTGVCCDGEIYQDRAFDDVLGDRGGVLVFYGFAFSAIARHWWKRYERRGWAEFEDVSVLGVGRDGPFAQNEFLRKINSPFRIFSDVDGAAIDAYDLRLDRHGLTNTSTATRAVFVLDADREVTYRWVTDGPVSPPPADEIEDAVAALE